MTSADILAEFESYPPPAPEDLFWLKTRVSVRSIALTWSGTISLIRAAEVVELDRGRFEFGRYQPGRPSRRAFILDAADQFGEVEDIVAFGRGWIGSWLGKATLLGADYLGSFHLNPAIPVWSSPMRWLASDRMGVVVIDPERAADVFRGFAVVAEDLEHARRLRKLLTPPAPRILLPAEARAAA